MAEEETATATAMELDSLAGITELDIKLPYSGKTFKMVRSTGRMQIIAQKQHDPAKGQGEFIFCCIGQTLTPTLNADQMMDLCNEDLDWLQEVYSKFNRTGKYVFTPEEVNGFFKSQSISK